MSHVTLRLPLDQYTALVEMVQISDWVITSRDPPDTPEFEIYRKVRNSVLSQLVGSGLEDHFEYSETSNEYYETPDYEENGNYRHFLDTFEEGVFWDELIERLVSRDLEEEVGPEQLSQLSSQDRYEKWSYLRQRYEREFETNGIYRIRLP